MPKIKILQIISQLGHTSGPTKTLQLLGNGLQGKGCEVSAAFYIGESGVAAQQLYRDGQKVFFLKNKGFGNQWQIAGALKKIIESEKIDIMHAHGWDADWFCASPFISREIKRVVTIHSMSYFHWAEQHCWKYRYIILPRVQKFVCVCEYLAKEFRKRFPRFVDKVSVIHNAPPNNFYKEVDSEKRSQLREEFGVSDNQYLIGTIGNLGWVKGINYLIDALGQIPSNSYKVFLVGLYQEDFKSILKERNLLDKVILVGVRDDVPDILEAIDLLVHPSVEEADPWVISEAMAKGKPIITTNVGGIPEKIQDGKTGILVASRDSQALAAKIIYCMENLSVSRQMGQAAKKFIGEDFSFESMVNKYMALYR